MCNEACIIFVARSLTPESISGRSVLEVGSRGYGARELLKTWVPAEYVGVDISPGNGVDLLLPAERISEEFGPNRFDIVLSTEMLEHVRDWRTVIASMKRVCKPDGKLVVTTRSKGYPFHAAPHDYWRFELDDMLAIFADFQDLVVEPDRMEPGVFVAARKPRGQFSEVSLDQIALLSMVTGRRTHSIPTGPPGLLRRSNLIWSGRIRQVAKMTFETARGRSPSIKYQSD